MPKVAPAKNIHLRDRAGVSVDTLPGGLTLTSTSFTSPSHPASSRRRPAAVLCASFVSPPSPPIFASALRPPSRCTAVPLSLVIHRHTTVPTRFPCTIAPVAASPLSHSQRNPGPLRVTLVDGRAASKRDGGMSGIGPTQVLHALYTEALEKVKNTAHNVRRTRVRVSNVTDVFSGRVRSLGRR
jgi:hypothetical protein